MCLLRSRATEASCPMGRGQFMEVIGAFSISEVVARGCLLKEDVKRLTEVVSLHGLVSTHDAEALIALHHACPLQDPTWPPFFADAITDFVVRTMAPEGYVSAANAAWLMNRLAPDGRISTTGGFDVVLGVLEAARWFPVSLACFALDQVRLAVVDGTGPLRQDRAVPPGTIAAREIELLRRILYAFASDGHIALTRPEAEVLDAIDAAVAGAEPNAEWVDLFVKAMANVALSASGHAIASRELALARSAAIADGDGPLSAAALRSVLIAVGYGGVTAAYVPLSSEERALVRLERQRVEIITGEPIPGGEAEWLADRLHRGTTATFATVALVDLLSRDRHRLPPALAAALPADVGSRSVAAA